MDRILVIGAGLVGASIIERGGNDCEVHAADIDNSLGEPGCEFHAVDITNKRAVVDLIGSVRPAAVFNTAELSDLERCEVDKDVALKFNGTAAGYVAMACARVDAYLCHISTDQVFNGKKGRYAEDEPTRPVNSYGESKLLGETEVGCLGDRWRWTVCRTSMLYGAAGGPSDTVGRLVGELKAGRAVTGLTDVTGSPTLADDLAQACLELWQKGARRIFHVCGREPMSHFDLALRACEAFSLDRSLVLPARSDELKLRAQRPPDTSLDVAKAEKFLGRSMLDVKEGLRKMKARMENGP